MSEARVKPNAAERLPQVVLITSSQFWVKGNGLASRTRELVLFLSRRFALTIAYLNLITEPELRLLQAVGAEFRLLVLAEHGGPVTFEAMVRRFRAFFNDSSPPAVYLIVQTELSAMLAAIPANGLRFVDTIDLVSNRTQSMADYQVQDHFPLSPAKEIELLNRYHRVICIQSAEYAQVVSWLGAERAILAPHPVAAVNLPMRQRAEVVGLIASRWHANVDGLHWFIEHVWPALAFSGLRLAIFGYVGEAFSGRPIPNMRCFGFVDDLGSCYSQIDIAINPVRYGAGLKIKTVEAMAYGLPQVVSRQGAMGLEPLDGKTLLIADDAASFVDCIKMLAGDFARRQTMAKAAREHIRMHFGPEQCFSGLAREIECLVPH